MRSIEQDRRLFLKASAASAVTVATAVGREIRAQDAAAPQKDSPGERIVLGIMGVNGRGAAIAQGMMAAANTQIGAICDVDTRAAIRVGELVSKKQERKPEVVGDFRRILDDRGASSPGLIDALLAPTRIYVRAVRAVIQHVHGMCHITGGGFVENVPRMFGERSDLAADIDLDAWQRPDVFHFLQQAGNVAEEEMLRTFNLGIGFILCVAAEDATQVVAELASAGERVALVKITVPSSNRVGPSRAATSSGATCMTGSPPDRSTHDTFESSTCRALISSPSRA